MSQAEDELAALIGRTFTYSDPSIYVDEDVEGDTFRIGDVVFSTHALACVIMDETGYERGYAKGMEDAYWEQKNHPLQRSRT